MITIKQVEDVLLNAGMKANLLGFKYIPFEVQLVEKYPYCKINAVHSRIGGKFGSNYSKVARCVRHAFESISDEEWNNNIKYLGKNRQTKSVIHHLVVTLKYECIEEYDKNTKQGE